MVILGTGQEVEGSEGEYLAKLNTSKSDFPWWQTDMVVPVGQRVEYKFAIRSASGTLSWKHPPNTLSFMFGDGSQSPSDCEAKGAVREESAAKQSALSSLWL